MTRDCELNIITSLSRFQLVNYSTPPSLPPSEKPKTASPQPQPHHQKPPNQLQTTHQHPHPSHNPPQPSFSTTTHPSGRPTTSSSTPISSISPSKTNSTFSSQ